jgi:hypothetical protein
MFRSAGEDWVLDEAEDLLDMDGRRGCLEEIAAGLQRGEIRPVDHVTARDQVHKRIRNRRTQ